MILFRYILPLTLMSGAASAADYTEAERLFTLKVGPMFAQKCNGCHGDDAEKIKGGLNMLTREDLLAGGEEFASGIIEPGNSDASFIMTAIRWEDADFEMPPKENDRLKPEQIELVGKWIDAGAPWPTDKLQKVIREDERKQPITEEGMIMTTSGGLGDEWTYRRYKPEDVWAFQPVKKPVVPAGEGNPIDAFVGQKLNDAGFERAEQADPRTLIRRATYDLTGLPVDPKETYDFIQAWNVNQEKAWSDLIDRLLASPQYGERWGQHWLDVTRYADTGGFSNDYERSNSWRYRDYVIRAFNNDKPYNEFVMEQLAGDEMDPKNPEMIVATGFLRMGPFDPAMVMKEEARQLYLDDVVNGVGQTFLSTTMRCFKCHDHKFDPLPTKDYYRTYAAFSTTQLAERPAKFMDVENGEGFEEGKANVSRLLAFAKKEKEALTKQREDAARKWFEEHGKPYLDVNARKGLPDEEKPPRAVGLDHVAEGQLKVREQDDWIWERRLERYKPLAQSVYNGPTPDYLNARKLRIGKKADQNWKGENFILTGGSIEAPGAKVTPGVLSAIGIPVEGAPADDLYKLPESVVGRRLAFAKWVADPQNQLTTRSIVNRVWQHHFGKAIAGNPNNFGVKGAKPTHPELLDWLAADFVENGWTMKRLHRTIMKSKTYQQAGTNPRMKDLAIEDSSNHLLAYFPVRRLTAEELRDSLLTVTGELNKAVGGLPIMPEINMEVALQPRMIQFSIAPAYLPSPTPEERNRRTIYAYKVRGQADPFLELFNSPNPNESCDLRDAAAVTPQVFTMMNSDLMTDRSVAFALRLQKEAPSLAAKIARAYHLLFSREPTEIELTKLTKYVQEMSIYHADKSPEPVNYPTQITRSLVEEFSGMPFEYEEILPVFERYTADKKPVDVSPETRGLADACLVLFNLNEFVYVY
jgi:mono/diheme cytochrome c family protein